MEKGLLSFLRRFRFRSLRIRALRCRHVLHKHLQYVERQSRFISFVRYDRQYSRRNYYSAYQKIIFRR